MGLFDIFLGNKKLQEPEEEGRDVSVVRLEMNRPQGSSGTIIHAGYYAEEYLQKLQGNPAADEYDMMRRSDPRIKMCLRAVKNPLRAATWEIQAPSGASDSDKKIRDFVQWNIFQGLTKPWKKTLTDLLSAMDFGHSLLEMVDGTVFDHPEFGTKSILRQLGWRSPKSLEQWHIDPVTGLLLSVEQIAEGDTMREAPVVMDARNLMLISIEQEGDNYEGESMLRACYGSWLRKQLFLKLEAIGIEKFAIPMPTGTYPKGKENSDQKEAFIQTLRNITSHNSNYAVYPEGYTLDFVKNDFDATKIRDSIKAENQEMTFAFLANFLELGADSGTGSYALGSDLSDFFLDGVQYIGEIICDEFNKMGGPIQRIVDRNFGPQKEYPFLACSGVSDKAGVEFGDVLKTLSDANILTPDEPLEVHVRKRYKLPEMDPDTAREKPAPTNPFEQDPENPEDDPKKPVKGSKDDPKNPPPKKKKLSERKIKLADRQKRTAPRRLINQETQSLEDTMQNNLGDIAEKYVATIMGQWRSLSDANKIDAAKNSSMVGKAEYKRQLFNVVANAAVKALNQARAEVPTVKAKKLGDINDDGFEFADFPSEFNQLPAQTRRKLKQRSDALVETQMADLDKSVTFQFQGSVDNSAGSATILQADLEDAAETFIEGASVRVGAANTASYIVNESRNAFFFDEDTLKTVQSFTFVNFDPVSPICTDLAGSTFVFGDPAFNRYFPPLHHNCKSFLSANLVTRPLTDRGLKPSNSDLEKFITLSEEKL